MRTERGRVVRDRPLAACGEVALYRWRTDFTVVLVAGGLEVVAGTVEGVDVGVIDEDGCTAGEVGEVERVFDVGRGAWLWVVGSSRPRRVESACKWRTGRRCDAPGWLTRRVVVGNGLRAGAETVSAKRTAVAAVPKSAAGTGRPDTRRERFMTAPRRCRTTAGYVSLAQGMGWAQRRSLDHSSRPMPLRPFR